MSSKQKKGLYQNNFQISICTKQSSKNKENLPKHSLFCCVLGDFLCNIFSKGYFDTVPFKFQSRIRVPLQKRYAVLLARLDRLFVPNARLHLADVRTAHHEHT